MDISKIEFHEWVKFVFDHPVEDPPWHFSEEWAYEVGQPHRVLAYLTRLFNTPEQVQGSFTVEQIDQGFWFLPGPNGLLWLILPPSIPWANRKECIQAMFPLFDKFLGSAKLESAAYMWWDSVITYCNWDNRDIISDKQVLGEVLLVMAKLAGHPIGEVRASAQHGIEHLRAISKKGNDVELDRLLRESWNY